MTRPSTTIEFARGDKVWVPLAVGRAIGTVVENRGPLGRNGERLYVVSVPNDPYSQDEFLLRESEVTKLSKEEEEQQILERLTPEAIKEFFINGGLLSILVRNSPKPVWLRRGPRGSITFTYIEGYSQTGGRPAPLYTLAREKIWEPKKDQVVEFVKSFDISNSMAEDIVSSVGTSH